MDTNIKKRFEAVQPLVEGDITLDPDFDRYGTVADRIEDLMLECFGGEIAALWEEYTAAQFEIQRLRNFQYFYEGYLTAKGKGRSIP